MRTMADAPCEQCLRRANGEVLVAAPDGGHELNARLMLDLLAHAASSAEGKIELPVETGADPEVSKVVGFLVAQGWLEEDGGDGTWTVTSSGRFWFESLAYGDIVTFYEYGGADFLLCTRSGAETIAWHKGRFATIGIAHFPRPEHFEVRRENEPVITLGGFHMQDALAAACALLADDLDVPKPTKLDELRLHMLNDMERLAAIGRARPSDPPA